VPLREAFFSAINDGLIKDGTKRFFDLPMVFGVFCNLVGGQIGPIIWLTTETLRTLLLGIDIDNI
jgi:hypothetical protein